MSVYKDKVRPAGGFIEFVTHDGWSAVFRPSEIVSVRGRREGGSVVHTVHGGHVLLDLPTSVVLAALKGAENATTA